MNSALWPPPPTRPLPRLYVAPQSTVPRRIDGAWWPRTFDLLTELPQLLSGLPESWGQIDSVLVNSALWTGAPGRLLVRNHVVRLHSTASAHAPNTVVLMASGQGRRDLLVVPPEATEQAAASLMSAAGLPAEQSFLMS
ncbi:DUF5994 family protein [Streptomyces thermoalcalitolerans]|uniref:DUF5994 family protein n=1 Tax=Streptomyces thermoalcalitolerans TaxID=65605 RepID=A0ABN1NDB2_9ACTN